MLHFNTYYHIFNHANGDDNLFREEKNYGFFLQKYHQHIDPIADTIAWCLMKNHFHLLVKIRSEVEIASNFSKVANFRKVENKLLSKQFSNFFSSYSQAFNKVYGRRGSLFIKNFKHKEISSDLYLSQIILYIHLNPVKHGFAKELGEWTHTSYAVFYKNNEELASHLFYNQEKFIEQHKAKETHFLDYQKLESELT